MNPLAWFFALSALITVDSRALMVMLPTIAASYGVTPGQIGYAVTAYTLSYGGLQVVYGPLSDRHGRLIVMRTAAVLFGIGVAVTAMAPSSPAFLFARLFTGAFAAAMVPTTFAYIGDTVPYDQRQTVIGRFGAVRAVAEVGAMSVAGMVAHLVSWRATFAGIAVLAFVPVLLLLGRREAAIAGRRREDVSYWVILGLARARRAYGAVFMEGVLAFGGVTYLSVVAKSIYGMTDLTTGLLLGCYGLGAAAGGISLRRLLATHGERTLARAGGVTQAVGFVALPFAAARPAAPIACALIGLGYVWVHSTLQTRATELMPEARGKAISLFALGLFLGSAVGTAFLGQLVDAGMLRTAMVTCGLGLGAVGFYVAAVR